MGQKWTLPIALGPVGATGTYARRGEVQAARAASAAGIPYTLSTVSICSIEEVARGAKGELWSQLYVLKDRGYMRNALERAWAAGMETWSSLSTCRCPVRAIVTGIQAWLDRPPGCGSRSRL
jgi:L-lactate dehydrogenase (cytochrome)